MKKISLAIACAVVACALAFGLAGCSGASEPEGLADGVYDIEIETDSSMVNVVRGEVEVADGTYTVTMALNGEGFTRIYQGDVDSALAAAEAGDSAITDYVVGEDGKYTFVFTVPALDEEIDYALYGVRRDTWYPHTLIFHSPGYGEGSEAEAADATDAEAQPEAEDASAESAQAA